MKKDFLKSKTFKGIAIATSMTAVMCTFLFANNMRDKTSAIRLESPFIAKEYGDNMFTIEGYGDLEEYIIRKDDGTGTGPLSFCVNKQKAFPVNNSVLYESITDDKWEWELWNGGVPTADQVDAVQRALYAYKYIWPEKLTSYGFDAENTIALYAANQLTEWSILEKWNPEDVKIKEDVKTKPQMYEYAKNVQRLYNDMYKYATNKQNSSYAEGIKVIKAGTEESGSYKYKSTDYVVSSDGKGYFRSHLLQSLPNQKAGYYYDGDYAFTYKVSLINAPTGTRIVNEYGQPQTEFSTKKGVGLNFYVDVPLEAVAGQNGAFKVKVEATNFRRNAPILWRPVTETAYQTLLQNASIPDSASKTIDMSYDGIRTMAQAKVQKTGEQLDSFEVVNTPYGKMYKPVYKELPLKNAKFTIAIKKETNDYFIDCDDGNTYVDGQNLIQKGNVITGTDGIAQFNRLPMDKNRDTTSYTITETSSPNGYLMSTEASKVLQLNKNSSDKVITNTVKFSNQRVKVYFEVSKLREYVSNDNTKEISIKPMEGAVFGIYTNQDITTVTGAKLSKDSLIGTVVSDSTGKVNSSSVDIPIGYKFYVKEIKTDSSLTLDSNKYYFDTNIKTDNKDKVKVELVNADGSSINKFTNKLARGSIVIDKLTEKLNNEGQSEYESTKDSKGFEFYVYADKNKTKKLATLSEEQFHNGKFMLDNFTPGIYYVEEVKANSNYEKTNTLFELHVKALEQNEIDIKNELKTFKHTLYKYDISTGERIPMRGVTFDVKYNGNIIDSVTTGSDGSAELNLKSGVEYTLSERVPTGYEKVDDSEIKVIGGNSKYEKIVVENRKTKISGSIEVSKIDGTSKKALSGVGFALYRLSDKNFEAPLIEDVTNEFGKLMFNNLSPDKYVLVETIPLKGYLPIENKIIDLTDIKDGEIIKMNIENNKYRGDIIVKKEDSTTLEPLEGAILGLFANKDDKNAIASAETGKDGVIKFENVPYGIYYIGEIKAPDGFELSDERVLVNLTDINEESITISYKNNPVNGSLELIKLDNDTDKPLKNAIFKLYEQDENEEKGKYIATLTTDENGIAKVDGIQRKKYYLEEVSAPTGYIISNKKILVDASKINSGDIVKVTAYNKKQEVPKPKGSITINKVDFESKEPTDATFILLNEAGKEIDSVQTDKGIAVFKDLILGKYTVIEKIAAKGYELNKTEFNITLTETDLHQTIVVENKPEKVPLPDASIVLTKYDATTGERIPGVEFTVYRQGNSEIYAIVKTDNKGMIKLEKVPNGIYTFIETNPAEGYIHNDIEYKVEINDDNRYGVISAYNQKEDTPDNPNIPWIPIDPSKPIIPSTPIDPSEPTVPSTPLEPSKPITPTTPLEPSKPEEEVPDVKPPVIEIEVPKTGIGEKNIFVISGAILIGVAVAGIIIMIVKKRKENNLE